MMEKRRKLTNWLGAALALVLAVCITGCTQEPPPPTGGGPIAMSRLTEAQYRQTVADIFGDDIKIFGRFEPDHRRDRLLAVGSAWTSITPAGFEQYDNMARGIAAQVLDAERRERIVPCRPAAADAADDDCAALFVRQVGRKLFRRPLTELDIQPRLALARQGAETFNDFYTGLEFVLASLLLSPEFLFRTEVAEADPANPGQLRLDAFSRAARLSYLLWNTTPDEALLAAAERGELDNRRGLAAQVERLLSSPRLEDGVRALFSDMLELDHFLEVAKDATLYPAYSSQVALDAREQTLRVIVDHLVKRNGDYRGLFTTNHFPLTRSLGLIYDVPVAAREGWEDYVFAADDQRAGILTHVTLLAQHSHPGRSSPTLRGAFIREALMCQPIPAPPADVDFTMDEDFEMLKTARERLERHRTDISCSGCHLLMDPIGLALENFDGIGAYRTHENGAEIDVSGNLDGISYEGAAGLGQALHDNPAVPACLVDTVYRYAVSREVERGERDFIRYLEEQFAESGYRLIDLLRTVVTSEAFFAVSAPRGSVSQEGDDS